MKYYNIKSYYIYLKSLKKKKTVDNIIINLQIFLKVNLYKSFCPKILLIGFYYNIKTCIKYYNLCFILKIIYLKFYRDLLLFLIYINGL